MDQIKFPVTISNELLDASVKQAITKIFTQVRAEIKSASTLLGAQAQAEGRPPIRPIITATSTIRSKGREYSISAAASPAEEGGVIDPSAEPKISIAINEVKQAVEDALKLQLKNIDNIKRRIKSQNLESRQKTLSNFLDENKRLQESLEGVKPSAALDVISQHIESSKAIDSKLKGRYQTELEKLRSGFENQDPGTQQAEISNFVQLLGDFEGEIQDKLTQITKGIDRRKLTELRTKTTGLEPAEKIAAYQEFIVKERVMVDEVRALIRLESKKLLDLSKSVDLKKLEELRTHIAMQVPEAQIRSVNEFLKNNADMPDYLKMKARNMKFRAQDKLSGDKFKALVNSLKGLDPEEQLSKIAEYVKSGGPGGRKVDDLKRVILDKKKGFDWKQLVEKASFEKPKDAIGLFVDYINKGGAFVQRAQNRIGALMDQQKNIDWKELEESAKLMGPADAIALFEDYMQQGGAFVKRAKARINTEIGKLSSKSLGQVKLDIKDMEPKDAINALRKFEKSIDKKFPANAVEAKANLRRKVELEIYSLSNKKESEAWSNLLTSISGLDPRDSMVKVQKFIDSSSGRFKSKAEALYRRLGDRTSGLDWQRLKESLRFISPELAILQVEDYLKKGGSYVQRAKNEIKHLQDKQQRLDWRGLRSRLHDPNIDIGIAIRELNDFIAKSSKAGGHFTQQAVNLRNRFQDKKQNVNWKDLQEAIKLEKPKVAMQMIQDYLDSGGKFIRKAKAEWNKQAKLFEGNKWAEVKLDIEGMKPEDARKRIQEYLDTGGIFVKQANNKMKKLADRMNTRDWNKIKKDAEIDPVAGLAATQDYIKNGGAFLEEAKRFEIKLQRRIESKDWDRVRRGLRGLDPTDALRALDTWGQTHNPVGEWKDKFDAEVRSWQKKEATAIKKAETDRIYGWKEYARGLSIEDRLTEINRVLNDPVASQRMKNAAKNLQQTALNNQRMNRERALKAAHKSFADQMLVLSGAGLGLLGPAGFPLLNIGFSAMSGGPMGAAIAAVTTAIGESTRALGNFTQKSIEAAKSLGMVSINAKIAEAQKVAFDAVMGQGGLASETAGWNTRLQIMREQGLAPVGFGMQRMYSDVKESIKTQFTEFMARPFSSDRAPIWETWTEQYKASTKQAAIDLPLAYEALRNEIYKTTTKTETDPYQTWMRMQNAAFDASKETTARVQQEMLKLAKEQLDAILGVKANTSKPKAAVTPAGG